MTKKEIQIWPTLLIIKHLTREFAQWWLNVLERFGIMIDTQAIDVVTWF